MKKIDSKACIDFFALLLYLHLPLLLPFKGLSEVEWRVVDAEAPEPESHSTDSGSAQEFPGHHRFVHLLECWFNYWPTSMKKGPCRSLGSLLKSSSKSNQVLSLNDWSHSDLKLESKLFDNNLEYSFTERNLTEHKNEYLIMSMYMHINNARYKHGYLPTYIFYQMAWCKSSDYKKMAIRHMSLTERHSFPIHLNYFHLYAY